MTELLLELTSLLSFWLCLAVWQRDRIARGRRPFIALSACAFLWSAGSLAEAHGALPPVQIDRLSYLAILPLPALWLALSLVVRGSALTKRAPWALAAILVPGACCYLLLFQEPDTSAWFMRSDPGGETVFGPLWWANAGYSWVLAGLGSLHFLRSASLLRLRSDRLRRRGIAVGSTLPLLANTAYVLSGMPGPDPTPILLGACLVALRSELFSGDLLQALPVAQHDLVNQLPTPLILTDLEGHVTEINPPAQLCLGVTKADALDRNVGALLEDAAFAPEFERWPIVVRGREAGSILLLASKTTEESR